MLKLDSEATTNSTDAIVQALEFDILFGVLHPRERLVEDALMRRFEAKRHVVREALARLDRMGIVVRTPHRGAAVRDFTVDEVEEIAEVRATLHQAAVKRMDLPGGAKFVATLERLQRRHDKAVAHQDPRAIDIANEAFHDAFFAACGNRVLASAIRHYWYLSRATRLYPLMDASMLETLRAEHWSMIEAIASGDRRALGRLVVDHIQHSKRMYLKARSAVFHR
ncbi:MAG: GntR family transcriptional regulator [Hyphomicrobiaceae bacterium]